MAIQKQEGCNKMVCGACGAFFCYRCGVAISGYEHFREGACVLFEMDDILRWEAQMAMQMLGYSFPPLPCTPPAQVTAFSSQLATLIQA